MTKRHSHVSTPIWLAWLVCLTAALFFFYAFIQMNMFNSLKPEITKHFNLSGTEFGNLAAVYLYMNVVMMLPAGVLLDRYSTKGIILINIFLMSLGTLGFSFADNIWFAVACRSLTGLSGAFVFLSCIRLASHWFPPQRMALITGAIVTFAMLGGIVAQKPLTLLIEQYNWQEALRLNAYLGFALTAIILFIVRDYPTHHTAEHRAARKANLKSLGLFKGLWLVMKSGQNWLCGLYTSLLNLPIVILGAVWGTPYLQQVHSLSRTDAATISTMVFIGMIIGSPLVGFISDNWGKRKPAMILGASLSVIIAFVVLKTPSLSFNALLVLFFALGFITSSQVISYPVIAESNPNFLTGSAMAISSILIQGGGGVCQPLFGWLLDLSHKNAAIQASLDYTTADYQYAAYMIPVAFIVALFAAFLIKETNCRPLESHKE